MRAPLRVLFVSPDSSSTSGVGRCIGDLLTNLDRKIIEPFLITDWPADGEQTIIPEALGAGIPVLHRELGRWFPSRQYWGAKHLFDFLRTLRPRIWSLTHVIEENHIDIVYTNALPCLDAALAARRCGRPHIWHLHEAVCGNQYLRSYLPCSATKRLIQLLSSRILFVSHQKAVEFAGGSLSAAMRVIHNGVNLTRYSPAPLDPEPLLQQLGLPTGTRLITLVGIVSDHKGHATLVRAAARVLEKIPNTAFLLAGNELANYGDELRELISDLNITSRVLFLGPQRNIPDLLRRVDLVVLPSKQEALPLVLLEAMAAGKPVVATRCGGPEEIVIDGKTGFLVDIGDPATLADRILEILLNKELAVNMGVAGRKRAEAEFSGSAFIRNVESSILEAHRTHAHG